jgi:predicted MFS family arabinose efflux permease
MLFSLLAGIVIDRVDKRRFLVWVQSAMMLLAFVLAALTFTGAVQYWHVLILSALLGLVMTFDMPTRQAFTVEMVGREDLMNAIALNSSMFNGARLIGPAVAGMVVAQVGEASAFALNGLSFAAVIAGLLMMRLPPFTPNHKALRPLDDLKEGFRFIASDRATLALGVVAAVPSIFGFPYYTLVPVMARESLGLGPDGFGILVSAIGLGALVGAVSLAFLGTYRPKGRLLTVATFVFAGALAGFSFSRSMALSLLALAFAGWGMITHLATTNTLLQLQIPDHLRGRVMSAYLWAVVGMAPLGALLFGSLAENQGAPTAILSGASVCALSAVLTLIAFPQVRRME